MKLMPGIRITKQQFSDVLGAELAKGSIEAMSSMIAVRSFMASNEHKEFLLVASEPSSYRRRRKLKKAWRKCAATPGHVAVKANFIALKKTPSFKATVKAVKTGQVASS
jgi:hypothetical protein